MIRTLFLVALFAALGLAQQPVDQAEYFNRNGRLASGPFCDSKCIPGGDWIFRRDWLDLESEYEETFTWLADSTNNDWWTGGCGADVNGLPFGQLLGLTSSRLKACRPEIIYMIRYELDYNHGAGYMLEKFFLRGSYAPTERNWERFVDDLFDVIASAEEPVTRPWNLLRMIPAVGEQPITREYDNDFILTQRFIANYERNFCSFTLSILPVQSQLVCDFNFDDDDTDSLNGLMTANFCDFITTSSQYDLIPGGCIFGDSDEDKCDRLEINPVGLNKRRVPAQQFKELGASIRHNAQVNITVVEHDKSTRSFDYYQQQIPDYDDVTETGGIVPVSSWSLIGNSIKYTYVPYSSSIASPYCAYRD